MLSLHLSLEANALLLEVLGRIPSPANDHGLRVVGKHALGIAIGVGVPDETLAVGTLHAIQRVLDRLAGRAVDQLILLAVPVKGALPDWVPTRTSPEPVTITPP